MATILITGAAGFIGSHFARYWTANHADDHVVVLDALTYAGTQTNLTSIWDEISFVHADIGDGPTIERTLAEYAVDIVVHFAAESHNSLAVLEPARFFRTNVLGTQALLEACRRAGIGRFHQVSTTEVYGDLPLDATLSFNEESPYRPRNPYNASKAGADHAVRAYYETFGLPITITNCANNYGPNQFPEKVIPLFITQALEDRPLPVYASKHNRREWIHVQDHCRAIDAVLRGGRIGETYHIGTGEEASIMQIADTILDELDLPRSLQVIVPDRPGHDRRYLLDSAKLRRELGWEPQINFHDGLRKTVRWYADNRSWWEALRGRSPVTEVTG